MSTVTDNYVRIFTPKFMTNAFDYMQLSTLPLTECTWVWRTISTWRTFELFADDNGFTVNLCPYNCCYRGINHWVNKNTRESFEPVRMNMKHRKIGNRIDSKEHKVEHRKVSRTSCTYVQLLSFPIVCIRSFFFGLTSVSNFFYVSYSFSPVHLRFGLMKKCYLDRPIYSLGRHQLVISIEYSPYG